MELIPQAAPGRQIVQRYRGGQFRISSIVYPGSVIVLPTETLPWAIASMDELTLEAFAALLPIAETLDVCLLGCGARMKPLPPALRAALKGAGLAVDPMDTGAACRTYNVLMGEGRSVAAALIAI